MKITRMSGLAALTAAAALVLTACGSDADSKASSAGSAATSAVGSVASEVSSAMGSESSAAPSSEAPASDTASSDTASSDTASSDTASSDTASSDTASSDTASSDTASSDTASSPTASGTGTPAAGMTFDAAGFKCATGELRSSGSTAQGKVIGQWIKDYNAKCSAKLGDYGGGGSGKGIDDFISKQTDFGGSDSALKPEQVTKAQERCGGPALNLPMVLGPIAIAYKLDGVDKLVLTPKVLGGIFSDTIKKWNDPAIAEINPGVTLPDLAIASVHRSDASGTTENFVKYLKANEAWELETGKEWVAPGGVGAEKSDGVAKAVAARAGTIGYVEWGFATSNNLSIAQIDQGSGAVELTAETAGKALLAAKPGEGANANDLPLKLDYATKEAGAYPLILVTYEIVCSTGNGDKAELVKSFMGYAATDGQAKMTELGAAPLPADLQAKVIEAIKTLG